MIVKTVKVPIYRVKLIMLAYNDPEHLNKWVAKHCKGNLDVDPTGFIGGFFEDEDIQYIAFEMGPDITPGVIAHEAKHAVNNLFTQIRMGLDPYNDEAECYLLGWYVDELHAFWDKIRKENKHIFEK